MDVHGVRAVFIRLQGHQRRRCQLVSSGSMPHQACRHTSQLLTWLHRSTSRAASASAHIMLDKHGQSVPNNSWANNRTTTNHGQSSQAHVQCTHRLDGELQAPDVPIVEMTARQHCDTDMAQHGRSSSAQRGRICPACCPGDDV